jgi:hypothetical protein
MIFVSVCGAVVHRNAETLHATSLRRPAKSFFQPITKIDTQSFFNRKFGKKPSGKPCAETDFGGCGNIFFNRNAGLNH